MLILNNNLVADQVIRRSIEAERFGKFEVFLQNSFHFRARYIVVQACHVEADVLGMEVKIFFVGVILYAHNDSGLRRL